MYLKLILKLIDLSSQNAGQKKRGFDFGYNGYTGIGRNSYLDTSGITTIKDNGSINDTSGILKTSFNSSAVHGTNTKESHISDTEMILKGLGHN